jgi:hypothetical protein
MLVQNSRGSEYTGDHDRGAAGPGVALGRPDGDGASGVLLTRLGWAAAHARPVVWRGSIRRRGSTPSCRISRLATSCRAAPGVIQRVDEIERFRQLVAAETFALRPLPSNRTRLTVRHQGMGCIRPSASPEDSGRGVPDGRARLRRDCGVRFAGPVAADHHCPAPLLTRGPPSAARGQRALYM